MYPAGVFETHRAPYSNAEVEGLWRNTTREKTPLKGIHRIARHTRFNLAFCEAADEVGIDGCVVSRAAIPANANAARMKRFLLFWRAISENKIDAAVIGKVAIFFKGQEVWLDGDFTV